MNLGDQVFPFLSVPLSIEATRKTHAPHKIALLTPILAPASSLARLGKASSARLKASQLALRIDAKIIDFLRHSSFASYLYP
jgi:hypothetical protein